MPFRFKQMNTYDERVMKEEMYKKPCGTYHWREFSSGCK